MDGETLQIFDSERADGSGRVGRVCAIDDESITISAGRGGIRVKRMRLGKGKKVAAPEFVKENGIKTGTRLGT